MGDQGAKALLRRIVYIIVVFSMVSCASSPKPADLAARYPNQIFPIVQPIDPEMASYAQEFVFENDIEIRYGRSRTRFSNSMKGEKRLIQTRGLLFGSLAVHEMNLEGQRARSNSPLIEMTWESDKKGNIFELESRYPGILELGASPAQVARLGHSDEVKELLDLMKLPEGPVISGDEWDVWNLEQLLPQDAIDMMPSLFYDNEILGWAIEEGRRVIVVKSTMDVPPSRDTFNISLLANGYVVFDAITFAPMRSRSELLLLGIDGSSEFSYRLTSRMSTRFID